MAGGKEAQFSGAQPRHFLRACVLLLLAEERAHGYELLERLSEFSLSLDSGAVYRLLRGLEHQGRLTSSWQRSDQGPARRCYALSPEGEAELQGWVAVLARSRDQLSAFVDRARARGAELGGQPQPAVARRSAGRPSAARIS